MSEPRNKTGSTYMGLARMVAYQESMMLRAYVRMGRKPPPSTPTDILQMYTEGRTI